MKNCLIAIVALLFCENVLRAQSQPLVVHEWGTFTSFQDETGRTIGGINSDDEPVPVFVHRLRWDLILGTPSQGAPRCFPDVTMRLETPVIYFHPPKGSPPITLDVTATFQGGWLTEYYPYAAVNAPGFTSSGAPGALTSQTNGTLKWSSVQVGPQGPIEQTTDHTWVAPRNVDAASVSTGNPETHRGEGEKYLFYRGVGHLDAPLQVQRDQDKLLFKSQLAADAHIDAMTIKHMWQYQMRDDGQSAFRVLKPMKVSAGSTEEYDIPATFTDSDFSTENLDKLRKAMHDGLVEDGLFSDEAEALLGTWELSYFKSSGMRILFLVPRSWTDRYLPLKISVPVEITRTMVGRIELVTPTERANLNQIVNSNSTGVQDLAYQLLGRFRNGLVLDEQKQNPSPALGQFISRRGLQPFGYDDRRAVAH